MDKVQALENIKNKWEDSSISLGEKILSISSDYYATGLELATTAAYIKATPIELDSLLELGGLDDEIIEKISEVNPPKTTWAMLASASNEEILEALNALSNSKSNKQDKEADCTLSEFIYQKMLEASGPTLEQRVENIALEDLKHALKKGEDFNALSDWEKKFLKSMTSKAKRKNKLTEKQMNQLIKILGNLVDHKAITRNSIDDDKEICDRILDALGRE